MGYALMIGKAAAIYNDDDKNAPYFWLYVEPCEKPMPPYGGLIGEPTLCTSYSAWGDSLRVYPLWGELWHTLERLVKEDYDNSYHNIIPIRLYAQPLQTLDVKIDMSMPGRQTAYKQLQWFRGWSEEALRNYGDMAALSTPGEWT